MTIATTSNKATWQGNGATTVFSFPFEIGNANQAALYLSSGGSVTLLSPSSYQLAGLGAPGGGTVTYPLSGSPIASGTSLTLVRTLPLQQLTDLVNQSNYFPDAVEGGLDYLMMCLQQVSQYVAYALQTPESDPTLNLTYPNAAARAGTLAGFDINGNAITYPITASVGAGNMTAELGSNGHPGFKNGPDFTGGTTTTLNLSKAYGSVANTIVAWDGMYVEKDAYQIVNNQIIFGSWSGSIFTPSAIPSSVQNVDVVGGTTLSMYVPPNGSVGPTQLQANSVGDGQLAWGNILGRVCDSIAQLGLLAPVLYTRAFVTGYYAAGDTGGGGEYVYSSSTSQASANNFTIIAAAGGIGCWLLVHNGVLTAEQAGAYNNGTNASINNTVFANIVAFVNAQVVKPRIEFAGTYAYSVSPNFAIQNAIFHGNGETHFQYSGTGNAVIMDGTGQPNDGAYDITWEGITVDAPNTAGHGYFIKNCHRARVIKPKVRGAGSASAGIYINGCVCSLFVMPEVSPNADNGWYLNAMPRYGIWLDGGVGSQASYNVLKDTIVEGLNQAVVGSGIYMQGALGNMFLGGTAEGCTTGITTATAALGCESNKVFGMDMESNTVQDIYEQGFCNAYIDCDTNLLITVVGTALRPRFYGGQHQSVSIAAGASYPVFDRLVWNRNGGGTFVDGSNTARGLSSCFDHTNNKPGPFTQTNVTVGASPYTFTNTYGGEVELQLSSGTISQLQKIRNGTGTLIAASSPMVSLMPGDQLQITYSATPNVWLYSK